jgi:DNA primase
MMGHSLEFLNQVRAKTPLSTIVSRHVALRRQGREWTGLSPFQPEKTPSFFVNDEKGFYHDFASGKHGDVFDFLVETEGVSHAAAVDRLATAAGHT